MNWKSKRTINVAICISLFSLGFLFGKFVNVSYFTIDEKINLIDMLSILATLGAAYYISKIIDKEKEDHRTEKDLILQRIEDIYQLIKDSQSRLTQTKVLYQVAASSIKQIYTSLDTACKVVTHTSIELKKDVDHKSNITLNLRRIRDLLTKETNVSDGIINLTSSRIAEIDIEFSKLKDNVLIFQVALNKG